jgi:hypothetical protein
MEGGMRLPTTILISALCACVAASAVGCGSCSRKAMDRNAASDVVTNLPEVKSYMRGLMGAEPPAIPFARAEAGPKELKGDYFMVTIGEDRPDRAVTWQRFLVNADDGKVIVEDTDGGGYIPLDKWRIKQAND